MRNYIFLLLVLVLASSVQGTQDKKWWTTMEATFEAFDNGIFGIYVPQYFEGHKDLAPGESKISYPYYVAVKMHIVGGVYWVIQDPGTVFVIDSYGKILRRWDCGNTIEGAYSLPHHRPTNENKKETSLPTNNGFDESKTGVSLAFKPLDVNLNLTGSVSSSNTTPTTIVVENNTSWVPWAVVGLAVITGAYVAIKLNPKYPPSSSTPVVNGPGVVTGGVSKALFLPPHKAIGIGFSMAIH